MRNVVLAALVAAALTPAASAQTATAWADKLFGGTTTHEFGVVARGAQLKHSFKMTNIYKVPLEITQIRVSCGCVRAEASVKVLQPNQTSLLHVYMDSRQFNGPKTVRVYVTVGPEYISTATLFVSANGRQDVVLNPPSLDFGQIARGQTPARYVDIVYGGGQDWRVTEIVKSAASPFELRVEELPRLVGQAPRRGYRLHATVKGDAPPGPFKQEIILKTNDPTAPVLTYHVSGTIQATLTVTPSLLNLTGLRVGEMQTKKVLVRGSRPFRITAVDGQAEGVSVDLPTRQDTTHILTVRVQPTRAGSLRRQLTLRTDLGNESAVVTIEGEIAP